MAALLLRRDMLAVMILAERMDQPDVVRRDLRLTMTELLPHAWPWGTFARNDLADMADRMRHMAQPGSALECWARSVPVSLRPDECVLHVRRLLDAMNQT